MVSQVTDNTASLSSLPDEVLVEVLQNLPFDALQKMRITDKRFYGLISDTPVILLNAMETFQDPRIAFLGAKTLGKNTRLIEKFLALTGMDKWEMHKWNWDELLAGSRYTLDDMGNPSADVRSLDLNQLHRRLQFYNFYTRSIRLNFDHFYQNASSNRDLVLATVKRRGSILILADASLKKDPEVVLAAVSQDGLALEYADASLKKDPEMALAAVAEDGTALQHVDFSSMTSSEVLKITIAAVSNCWLALKYADSSLQDDEIIVRIAMLQTPDAIEYASPRLQQKLKTDRSMYSDFVRESVQYFKEVNFPLITNKSFVLRLIKITCRLVFEYLDPSQRNDEDFLKAALKGNRDALSFTSDRLKEKYTKDKTTVLNMISGEAMYFMDIDSSLQDDEDVLEAALFYIGKQVHPKYLHQERKFILWSASDRLQNKFNNRK